MLISNRAKVNSMAIHPTGKIALSVGTDRCAIVWNLMTGKKASINKLGRGREIDRSLEIVNNILD